MRLSNYSFHTRRETPSDADSANAQFLNRGRFVEQSMAGVYNFLPLGWMVMERITAIVRFHMNATGAFEGRFVTLQDKATWEKTGRWEKAADIMYQFEDHSKRPLGLGFSHEEVVMDLLGRQQLSYQDFPFKLYQIQTKFRHEARAKSGLLRGREFIMKDLYSAHVTQEDQQSYYNQVRKAYLATFADLGIPALETLAAGGVFTQNFTHEYQVESEVGEDTVYVCDSCTIGVNEEIIQEVEFKCPNCKATLEKTIKSIEVGNIFDLGTFYSEKMDILFTDSDGARKPFWFASYGIGVSRAMATIVEKHHDEKGIKWPVSVAPFLVHLVGLAPRAESIYKSLRQSDISVLFDDRDLSAGQKFADADLLGMPIRLTVGTKTAEDEVEWHNRLTGETTTVTLNGLKNRLLMMQLEDIEQREGSDK